MTTKRARIQKNKRKREKLPRQISRPRSEQELKLLKAIARKIHSDLYNLGKPVEWLAFESETSRATVRRIFDADRNIGLITLDRVARAVGYADIIDFFRHL